MALIHLFDRGGLYVGTHDVKEPKLYFEIVIINATYDPNTSFIRPPNLTNKYVARYKLDNGATIYEEISQ